MIRGLINALTILSSSVVFGTIMFRHYGIFTDTIPSYLMFLVLLTNIRDLEMNLSLIRIY